SGSRRSVTPRDVNNYIKAAMGPEYSAKDLRVWGATLLAAVGLAETCPPESETQAKRNVAAVMKRVAERLGNTPAICRGSYVHPTVIERYLEGVTLTDIEAKS